MEAKRHIIAKIIICALLFISAIFTILKGIHILTTDVIVKGEWVLVDSIFSMLSLFIIGGVMFYCGCYLIMDLDKL